MTALSRTILSTLALLAVAACVPRWPTADWSNFVSKTETLRFLAGAACDVPWPFNPVPADAAFFQVIDLRPVQGRPWSYDVGYVTSDGERRDRLDITQWWTAAGTRTSTQHGERQHCAVLVDIPRSKNAERPYYLEDEQAKAAEHDSVMLSERLVFSILCVVFVVALIPSVFGFEDGPNDMSAAGKWALRLATALVIVGVSLIVGNLCLSEPWQTFQKAVGYYSFYNKLPRNGSGLLPIAPQNFYFLLHGPPHPKDTQPAFETYVWITGVFAVAWLVGIASAFVKGLYWICTPLPLEQAHRQALREGRTLSAEEILAAMNKAVVGKRAWQINIMRRKAEAFARTFGYVANSNF